MAYPPSDPANNKADSTPTTTDHAAHHNTVANAIIDIIDELGSGPKGGSADLTARLSALDTTVAAKETPAGAQAKADAKVADAINDGTTTVAPSQNAVFDALALKQAIIQRLWIPASLFMVSSGSPVLSTTGGNGLRPPTFLLDAASAEKISASFVAPVGWSTYNVKLYWTNAGAGAGDVTWNLQIEAYSDGEAIDTLNDTDVVAWGVTTITAPAQRVLKISSALTSVAVESGILVGLDIARRAADGTDTLANDVGVLGVMIERAS